MTRSGRSCGPSRPRKSPLRSCLAAGGVVALSAAPETGVLVVTVCVVGALSTVAAGCRQSAKVVTRSQSAPAPAVSCGGTCATCTLSCD